jgi:ATP-dependent DNA helicase RecQ
MISQAKEILKNVFGYSEFRPLQESVIENVLEKKDTLVIMPTGGGKSLCYQIPALIFEGLTIVVSPLISLMKDQVEQLHELGVSAVVLNSSLSTIEYDENTKLIKEKKAKMLYVAPETLMMERTLNLLASVKIDCLTIDEAHCISEWGHDFRPEYRRLADLRSAFPDAVTMALTATATPRVQQDITRTLQFTKSNVFIASFNRENLFLQVIRKNDPFEQTLKFLRKHENQSGIIYCFSRKQVNELYEQLHYMKFSVRPYHAGLSDADRKKHQELFIKDDVQIIVATIAFGMGINKPNVRFVIHYDLPKNIESYYQEIGRAG